MLAETYPIRILLMTFSGLVNRHQTDVIAYLVEENRVLKEQMAGRAIRLSDDQRRRLAAKAKLLGRRALNAVANIVTPDTLMRWHHRLLAALVHKSPLRKALRALSSRSGRSRADPGGMNSRVHPKYKTRYRVTNWAEYEASLVQRGDLTMWITPAALDAWKPKPSAKRGAPRKYSDLAIETALTLRLVFRLPLRHAEGFLRSLLELLDISLEAPDHTTPSRRSRDLKVDLRTLRSKKPIHLILDSTGLSIVGEGEWAAPSMANAESGVGASCTSALTRPARSSRRS